MTVPLREAGYADFSLPAITVCTQVHLYSAAPRIPGYVLDCSPKGFDKDFIVAAFST
jgi:hypothetical protein